jgi:predicted nucleic-acid-binding Zn-ribbon protein
MATDDFKSKEGLPSPEIDFVTVKSFFANLGVNFRCEVCGNEDFGIQTKEFNGTRPSLIYGDGLNKALMLLKSYFIARCETCGNTKLFDTDVIEAWMEAKNGGNP